MIVIFGLIVRHVYTNYFFMVLINSVILFELIENEIKGNFTVKEKNILTRKNAFEAKKMKYKKH